MKTLYTYAEYVWLCCNFCTWTECEILVECLQHDAHKFHPGINMELADLIEARISKTLLNPQ